MVKVHMMKAYEGDFIWLSYGDSEKEYHLLIDGGIKECREKLDEKQMLWRPLQTRYL